MTNLSRKTDDNFRPSFNRLLSPNDLSQRLFDIVAKFVRFWYNIDESKHYWRDLIMSITATELKTNLGKYLILAETEDIYITRNGKVVAKLTNPYQDRVEMAKSLFGIIPADITLEEAREERLSKV